MQLSPRSKSASSVTGLATSSPEPKRMIEGPATLVSTVDSAGLWVPYTAVNLPTGGSYAWSVFSSNNVAIELQSPTTNQVVQVRAMESRSSKAPADQTLRCTYTYAGQQILLDWKITVAIPNFAMDVNGGRTTYNSTTLSRVIDYQILDQFVNGLREVYAYTNASGTTVNRRVVNLLVSEQLTVIVKDPSSAPNPVPEENHALPDDCTFNDTHSIARNVRYQVNQYLRVHIQPWQSGGAKFGNTVRPLIIRAYFEPNDPLHIHVYDNVGGNPGNEIPEEP